MYISPEAIGTLTDIASAGYIVRMGATVKGLIEGYPSPEPRPLIDTGVRSLRDKIKATPIGQPIPPAAEIYHAPKTTAKRTPIPGRRHEPQLLQRL